MGKGIATILLVSPAGGANRKCWKIGLVSASGGGGVGRVDGGGAVRSNW